MKCPKCGYLGFETTERCRHCGYDFSLSVHVDDDASNALSLRNPDETEAPFADFDLSGFNSEIVAPPTTGLDLDRIIGTAVPREPHEPETAVAVVPPPPEKVRPQYQGPAAVAGDSLPLFTGAGAAADHVPPPPPARPPLAVRRATPEVARRRTPRTIRRDAEGMALQLEPVTSAADRSVDKATDVEADTAPVTRRLVAAIVDMVILGSINAAVLYLTLAITGLSLAELRVIPPIPMVAFLLLLNGGYLIGFTVTNGQTIGKMMARIRVMSDQGDGIDLTGAVLRATGALVSVMLLGIPYLPVLFSSDRRALHDRLAATRVIKLA
jgi:uncharacterized RDD family membrane protein YckC